MRRIPRPRALLLSISLLAVMAGAPFAIAAGENEPVQGGARNPSSNKSQSYTRETEIIANTSTYGTRQSNKSANGGGAIYGCRSGEGGTPKAMRPCIRANNLSKGLAFEFDTDGVLGGTFTVGNGGDNTRPFTTNATGVATGLNADRVDGKSADDFLASGAKATDADKLDGKDSSDFAASGDLLFAAVSTTGNVSGGRGATGATLAPATNTFTVTFNRDVSKCSYTATKNSSTADQNDTLAAAAGSSANQVVVDEDGPGVPFAFHLQVIC